MRIEDILLMIMCFAWLARSAIHKDIGLLKKTILNSSIRNYLVVCLISTLWAIIDAQNRATTVSPFTGIMFIFKYFEYFIVFFMVSNFISTRKQVKNYLHALFITCAIVVILGMLQISQGGRISTPFEGQGGEPNTLGGYLVLMISLTTMFALHENRTWIKLAYGSLSFFSLVALGFTYSRSSWAALVVVVPILLLITKKRLFLVSILIIAIIVTPFIMPKRMIQRIQYTYNFAKFEKRLAFAEKYAKRVNIDPSTAARISQIKNVIEDIRNHPILGYGVTGWFFLDSQFPRVFIETGILGLITFIMLIVILFRELKRILKLCRGDPLFEPITIGLIGALVGLIFHSIGTNTFIIVRIMEPFWFLVAMALLYPEISRNDPIPAVSIENGTEKLLITEKPYSSKPTNSPLD